MSRLTFDSSIRKLGETIEKPSSERIIIELPSALTLAQLIKVGTYRSSASSASYNGSVGSTSPH